MKPGDVLGAYRVVSELGAGGMGVVFKARDTVLNRDVALKVLPESLAGDPDRLMRFEREAQALAALNHPNIAQIYGIERFELTQTEGVVPPSGRGSDLRPASGRSDPLGTPAIVMELVDGPTLADRIKAGPIPLDEALPIARQIAEGLEAAHERGILHRDLKPANIKVRGDGTVKLLDFGLAKALAPRPGSPDAEHLADSPTVTGHATEHGVILGTAAYMSPEQAKGEAVDTRADVWAFGVLLYELLTGQRAFRGEQVTEVLAAVLKDEPDWSALAHAPDQLRSLTRRCLARNPRQRLRDLGDARIELEEIGRTPEPRAPMAATASRPWWRQSTSWMAVALAGAVGIMGTWTLTPAGDNDTEWVTTLPPDEDAMLGGNTPPTFAVSHDGQWLAYVTVDSDGETELRLKNRAALRGFPVSGVPRGVYTPFFSADGQQIAFRHDGRLWRIPVTGGVPTEICEVPSLLRGADWAPDGTIVVGLLDTGGLATVPATGGTLTRLVDPGLADLTLTYRFPHVLPDGDTVVFSAGSGGAFDTARIGVVSIRGGDATFLPDVTGMYPRYASTGPTGHLVFGKEKRLYAVPFDPRQRTVRGTPVTVLDDVQADSGMGTGHFEVSDAGDLVFVPVVTQLSEPVFVDPAGRQAPIGAPIDTYGPRVLASASGNEILLNRGGAVLWDLVRKEPRQITTHRGYYLAWTPDDTRVVFDTSDLDGGLSIATQPVEGGPLTPVAAGVEGIPTSVTASGTLIYMQQTPESWKIKAVPLDGSEPPRILVDRPGWQGAGTVSADERLLAYVSAEQGVERVYVATMADLDVRVQVSNQNGGFPRWARNGRDLYFIEATGETRTMMAATIGVEPALSVVTPRHPLFDVLDNLLLELGLFFPAGYDVTPDGRFVFLRRVGAPPVPYLVTVGNWFEELNRLVPIR